MSGQATLFYATYGSRGHSDKYDAELVGARRRWIARSIMVCQYCFHPYDVRYRAD